MNGEVSNLPAEVASALELGATLGENRAFGRIAGRCSAAQAAALRRIREEKLYKSCTPTWGEFCPKYLGMSKRHADEMIQLFEQFGRSYFEMSQLTRISAGTYRTIAAAVYDRAIHIEGRAPIALIPENAAQVTAAVAELRRESKAQPKPAPTRKQKIDALARQCGAVADAFTELAGDGCSHEERASLWQIRAHLLVQLHDLKIAA